MILPPTKLITGSLKLNAELTPQLMPGQGACAQAGLTLFLSLRPLKILLSSPKPNCQCRCWRLAAIRPMELYLGNQMKLVSNDATVIILKNTGHWLMEENPKETMDALVKFL